MITAAYTTDPRELTRPERATIKKLVIEMCANYDKVHGCLPLDCDCYMFGKCWTGSYCKYFQKAVLPLEPMLEAALLGGAVETRPCGYCGEAFPASGKQAYCSDACAGNAQRKRNREHMRKKRSG